MSTTECRSPAHKQYRDALEGLYIQTKLAYRDLGRILEDATEGRSDNREIGLELNLVEHKIIDVEERLAFGRQQLADASVVVNRHFDSGCRLLTGAAS